MATESDIKKYDEDQFFVGTSLSEDTPLQKLENDGKVIVPTQNFRKISTDSGTAQIWVEDDVITITRGEVGIGINKDCIVFSGRTHMTKNIEQNRVNGFWTWNPELLTCLPSTTYTPIPVLLYTDPPYAKQAGALMTLLA